MASAREVTLLRYLNEPGETPEPWQQVGPGTAEVERRNPKYEVRTAYIPAPGERVVLLTEEELRALTDPSPANREDFATAIRAHSAATDKLSAALTATRVDAKESEG